MIWEIVIAIIIAGIALPVIYFVLILIYCAIRAFLTIGEELKDFGSDRDKEIKG